MDFFRITQKENKDGSVTVRPDWKVGRTTDLMTRTGTFYAVWDESLGMWSTDIYDVPRLVDAELYAFKEREEARTNAKYIVSTTESHDTRLWDQFMRYLRNSGDTSHELDRKLTFLSDEPKKGDYRSKRLPYDIFPGRCDAWEELTSALYTPDELTKIEWAIGAILTGKSTSIQKFLVLYGPPGSGKSTILNIIEQLFVGYISVFDSRELAGNNNTFSTAAFKSNPLVAIQHDGDLSRIVDNTKLNSIVAHEVMIINEKYRAPRESRSRAFVFMGTNVPVKITDAKSGILRRLIDVVPTGNVIPNARYQDLMRRIGFELGAIAHRCQDVFIDLGENFYSDYRPREMMLKTDVFFNFVEDHLDVMKQPEGVTLKRAYILYKEYCSATGIDRVLPQYKFREELRNYFLEFKDRTVIDGAQARSVYIGFKPLDNQHIELEVPVKPNNWLSLHSNSEPPLDILYEDCYAQYANKNGTPTNKWEEVATRLRDIDTTKLHYVKPPEHHIVIDMDIKDDHGQKSLDLCLREAENWPPTYAEVSQSGNGLHLHYVYSGDPSSLSSSFSDGVEVKSFSGNSALRRKSFLSNDSTITTIDSGLPRKEPSIISQKAIRTEKALRELVLRNLRKEIHPGTKPSVDFIHKILEDAYANGISYDLTDLRGGIVAFAAGSTNQAKAALKLVSEMKFVGQEFENQVSEKEIVFFDVEVFPNLFVVCWKAAGSTDVVRMINPTPENIEELLGFRLVGFNNRRYDNHILYARILGFSNEELFNLSDKLVNSPGSSHLFGAAYDISYTDVYDFSSKKQGLKKFEIELQIPHKELNIPWDQPVKEALWGLVADYCANDVLATESVFNARRADFKARLILAELSGLTPNQSTQSHTARIIFGEDRNPQQQFVYTDLSKMFPGYKYDAGESTYRGEVVGEGGFVYAEPGYYTDVTVMDVASMHPTSIVELDLFGPYTPNFKALMDARLAIKSGDVALAKTYLDGRLAPFLDDEDDLEELSYALKIVINIVYGLTSARFSNMFRDNRNKDNIVAKRGSLFMIDLKDALSDRGVPVIHIKTDSVKIANLSPEDADFIMEFGRKYGYTFEVEDVYDKFCLVNNAVYVAKQGDVWEAVGAQFQDPIVFKTIFSGEPLVFDDYCVTKNVVKGVMYLETPSDEIHIGKTGSFVCVEDGGSLLRVDGDNRYFVTGTKGYLWITREMAEYRRDNNDVELRINHDFYNAVVVKAKETLEKYTTLNELKD